MVTRAEWYERVNAAWPEHVPVLTADEAVKAARKLYRFVTRRTWTGEVKLTSGARYSDIRHGVMYVNPTGHTGSDARHHGWKALVHDLSHDLFHRIYEYDVKGHGGEHARLELRMIKEVVKRGWLDGALSKETPKPEAPVDARVIKLRRIEERIARWRAKQRRAENALKKLHRQERYYSNQLAA